MEARREGARDRFFRPRASNPVRRNRSRTESMPMHLEDWQLARRLRKGDERAFEQFFRENFPRLYRFARARLPDDRETTREIVQSVLSKAVRNIGGYRGESSLFTWLCVICRNEIADWRRRTASYREHIVLCEDYPEIRAAVESFTAPASMDPLSEQQRLEAARLVQVALDHLPAHYGDALEWKYIEGRSVREIAARLAISAEAAQSLLARARRAFAEVYGTLAGSVFHQNQTTQAQS